jgi:hypothetical protein
LYPLEGVLVALGAGQCHGRRAHVDEQFLVVLRLGGDGQGGGRGRHVEDDVRAAAFVQLLSLGVGDVRLVLVVGRRHLDLVDDRLVAVLLLVVGDGHLDRFDGVGS